MGVKEPFVESTVYTELDNLQEMLEHAEMKLFKLNQDLNEKKAGIEKALQEILKAAIKVNHQNNIKDLAAGMAHEIRNPLTAVRGFLQLLKPDLKSFGKEHYADIALSEINRANEIIYEFLNTAKPNMDPIENTSLTKVVHEIMLLFQSEATLRDIEMITQIENTNLISDISSNQLKQVLMNLIKNAFEAIEEYQKSERKVYISTKRKNGSAFIEITDTGCGLSEESIKKLFVPFYSTKEKGTGIGLSVCKRIIEDHDGTIYVKSSPGVFTTFTIVLPLKIL